MKIKFGLLLRLFPFIFGLAIGLYFIVFNIIGTSFSHYPGDLGDARLNTYFLEHAHLFITGQEKSFWNAPFMYPEKDVISYSDNLLGTAPFYIIFRLLNFDRETSFQLWFVLMAILSYASCYFLLKLLFKNNYAAAIGAMVFAFSMALQSQLTHAQTFPRFPIPLAFAMLVLFIKDFSPKYFFLTILVTVYQLYCGIYLGLMLMIPISVMFLLVFIFHWKKFIQHLRNLKWLGWISISLIINVLITLPLILPYIARSKMVGMNSYEHILPTIPTFLSFFYSQKGSLIWDFLSNIGVDIPAFWDHQIFAGGLANICLIILMILVLIKISTKNKLDQFVIDDNLKILTLTTIITFLLFIRFENYSLYKFVFSLPGFGSMRSITRIINIELIFYAITVAFIVRNLLNNKYKLSMIWFILIASFVVADNYYKEASSYRTEKFVAQSRVKFLMEKMKDIPEKSVVSYEPIEIKTNCVEYQLDAMLAAQSLNLISVNGYTATSPGTYTNYWKNLDSASRMSWFKVNNVLDTKVYVIK